jgi:mono/diheme cytochrome c family protein
MRSHLSLVVLLFALNGALPAEAAPPDEGGKLTFEKHIRPILKAYCFNCHGAEKELRGGLDLRLRRLMVQGGESGPAIVPGDAEASYLLQRVRAGEMPPSGKPVPESQIKTLAAWIASGAATARPEPEKIGPGVGITPEERAYWAFQPVERPSIPAFDPEDRVRTPIDALLLARMREKGLSFSPDADKRTLIRRATLDQTGLPPTPPEVERLLADESPHANGKLIDRLLASPRYGERWGRHWLDVAGYAESEGYTKDPARPYAYKYRDYVVRSLNEDKPFDQFIVEQLAGDELVEPPYENLTPEEIEKLTATGFLRMAADGTASRGDQRLARNQVVADTLKIVSTSLLGLSVGCAQCHDHRYDPIPQADYYALRAIFEPALDVKHWRNPAARRPSLYTEADKKQAAAVEAEAKKLIEKRAAKQKEYLAAALEKELQKHPEALRGPLREAYQTPAKERTDEQKKLLAENPSVNITPGVLYQYDKAAADDLKKMSAEIEKLRATKPPEDFLRALTEVPGQVPTTYLFHRGDYKQPTDPIAPAALTIAAPEGERFEIPSDDSARPTTGRRLAYARHLTSGEHPLVGRVLMNRIWLHHFGRGIVETPGEFGKLGALPTHPKLLDLLADELVRRDWSLKAMHRLIMTSTVYRQASRNDPAKRALDRENRLYWRMPLRRLEAEALRDRMLWTSGALDDAMGGPAAPLAEDKTGQVAIADAPPRRSLYLQKSRSAPASFLVAFDAPVMKVNCDRRASSTVATQSLMLMNGAFVLKQAELFAERLARETPDDFPVPEGTDFPALRSAWRFGYGAFDAASGRTADFRPLTHWTQGKWQGGAALPDPRIGWALLTATGGHPGDARHAAIRRWTAPADGVLTIDGKLKHSSENGDGVRGRVVSSRSGAAGEWTAQHGEASTAVAGLAVRRGDTLDFIVDCRADTNSDSFAWTVDLRLAGAGGEEIGRWNSSAGFHGPAGPPLARQVARAWRLAYQRPISAEEMTLVGQFLQDQLAQLRSTKTPNAERAAMTNLCQQLLGSNEFLYVD